MMSTLVADFAADYVAADVVGVLVGGGYHCHQSDHQPHPFHAAKYSPHFEVIVCLNIDTLLVVATVVVVSVDDDAVVDSSDCVVVSLRLHDYFECYSTFLDTIIAFVVDPDLADDDPPAPVVVAGFGSVVGFGSAAAVDFVAGSVFAELLAPDVHHNNHHDERNHPHLHSKTPHPFQSMPMMVAVPWHDWIPYLVSLGYCYCC